MKKKCFIITPIGDEGSEIRKKAEGVIDSVIKPVLDENNYEMFIAHKISKPGSITNQIISHLINDDLVIANLTGPNPNVMYELAVRHATSKPVVCITEKSTKLPFDLAGDRAFLYEDSMAGVSSAREELKKAVIEIHDDEKPDDPISRALQYEKVLIQNENIHQMANSIKGEKGDALKIILEKLTLMEQNIKRGRIYPNKDGIISYEVAIDIEIGKINTTQYVQINEEDSVQNVLDMIFFLIQDEVSPGEYMKSWVLKEKTKGVYMIMYEITNIVPANIIFRPYFNWKVIRWDDSIMNTIHQHRRNRANRSLLD